MHLNFNRYSYSKQDFRDETQPKVQLLSLNAEPSYKGEIVETVKRLVFDSDSDSNDGSESLNHSRCIFTLVSLFISNLYFCIAKNFESVSSIPTPGKVTSNLNVSEDSELYKRKKCKKHTHATKKAENINK